MEAHHPKVSLVKRNFAWENAFKKPIEVGNHRANVAQPGFCLSNRQNNK